MDAYPFPFQTQATDKDLHYHLLQCTMIDISILYERPRPIKYDHHSLNVFISESPLMAAELCLIYVRNAI